MIDRSMGIVRVHGADVHYEMAGEGHPLLLVHGGLGDSRMWDRQMRAFASHFRTVCFDLPGYGRSETVAGPFRGHDFLPELLRTLEVKSAYVLGLSLGGRMALDFALSRPDLVDALVLAASGVSGRAPSPELTAASEEADRAYEEGDLERAVELELQLWIDGPRRRPEQIDLGVRESVRTMNRDNWLRAADGPDLQFLDPPAAGRLAEIRVPVLVIVGDADVADIGEQARFLTDGITGAQMIVVHGAAHHLHMEQPEEFNHAVVNFLLQLERGQDR